MLAMFSAGPAHAKFNGTLESGFDRPGSDFETIRLDKGKASSCAALCDKNAACKAYTYVKPGVQGKKAVCYLKHTVRPALKRDCCVSGVKKSALRIVTLEPGRDRPGANYKDRLAPIASPNYCQNVCRDDAKCKAFTYVKPGVQGPKARCWYKDAQPATVQNGCCTSGRKTMASVRMRSYADQNRPGGDYRSFRLTHPDSAVCASVCALEDECKSYTRLSSYPNSSSNIK